MKKSKKSSDQEAIIEEAIVSSEQTKETEPLEVEASPVLQDDKGSEVEAVPLESLLLDDDQPQNHETKEETVSFENFLNEYKAHISKTTVQVPVEKSEDPKEEIPKIKKEKKSDTQKNKSASPSKKKNKQKEEKQKDNWENEISLLPETYESPDEEDNIFRETPLPEEEPAEEAFSIGKELYSDEEDEMQISIKFEETPESELASAKEENGLRYDPEHPRFLDNVFDFLELFVITLVCVMILTTFVFKHSIVEGRSMQNTLHEGDSLIITDLFYTPERFDIVVFEDYSTSLKKAVVKRVIGLPGEKVEVKIDGDGNYEVYINDELLPEEYAYNAPDSSPPLTGVWYIEDGEVFVMGDNRYNSTDSRDPGVGPIDIECILGKVILRFYPFDKFGKVE